MALPQLAELTIAIGPMSAYNRIVIRFRATPPENT
jgi:hypothetical protein